MIAIGLICLLAASVHGYGSHYVQNDPHCYGKHVGYKYQNVYDCSQYYTCTGDDAAQLDTCYDGQLFNSQTQSCDNMQNVQCERPKVIPDCSKALSGSIYEHDDCTKYMMCDNGELVEQECESGLAFDMDLKICNWADRTKCPQAFSKYD